VTQAASNAGSKQLAHRELGTSSRILYCGHSTQYSHLVKLVLNITDDKVKKIFVLFHAPVITERLILGNLVQSGVMLER